MADVVRCVYCFSFSFVMIDNVRSGRGRSLCAISLLFVRVLELIMSLVACHESWKLDTKHNPVVGSLFTQVWRMEIVEDMLRLLRPSIKELPLDYR